MIRSSSEPVDDEVAEIVLEDRDEVPRWRRLAGAVTAMLVGLLFTISLSVAFMHLVGTPEPMTPGSVVLGIGGGVTAYYVTTIIGGEVANRLWLTPAERRLADDREVGF